MDAQEAEHYGWRHAVSAENVGIASTVAGAADTLAQFATHATPEGMVGLGAVTLGLVSLGLGRVEKYKSEKAKKGKP
jgi:hypothetical protein